MIDLTKQINDVIDNIDNLRKKERLHFDDLQNISRNNHYLVLLQALDTEKKPDEQNIIKCFETYYKNTHENSSFITAHPDSAIGYKLYDLVLSIGEEFKISPIALIFPNLEIADGEMNYYSLWKYEDWKKYQQTHPKTTPQKLLCEIVEQYLCGEKTLVYKDSIRDYLLSTFKDGPALREIDTIGQKNSQNFLSEKLKQRINHSIHSEELRAYRLLIQPDYSPTFKGALERLSERFYKSGKNSTIGSTAIAGMDASWALFDFHPILAKYENSYRMQCGNDEELLNFLDFLLSNGLHKLVDNACIEGKVEKIQAFLKKHSTFIEQLDPDSANIETPRTLEKNNYIDKITKSLSSELFKETALPLDITSLKNNKLELETVLQYAELISFDALKTYLEKNPGTLVCTWENITEEIEEKIQNAFLLYPQHFHLMFQSISLKDRESIIDILHKVNIARTITNIISDPKIPRENKEIGFSFLTSLTKYPSEFKKISSNLPEEERKIYSNSMMEKLLSWSTHYRRFNEIYLALPKEEQALYFNSMKHQFLNLTKEAYDFHAIMSNLSEEDKSLYSNSMKDHRLSLTKDGYDFFITMVSLSKEDQPIYLDLTREHWSNLTKKPSDFAHIHSTLPLNEQSDYIKSVNKKLDNWGNTSGVHDIITIYEALPEYKKQTYFDSIKKRLVGLTTDQYAFSMIYSGLSIPHRSIYFNLVLDQMLRWTTDSSMFTEIYGMETLSESHKSIYLNAKRKQLVSITKTLYGFIAIVKTLPEAERSNYCNLVGKQLLDLIKKTEAPTKMVLQETLELLIQNQNYETANDLIDLLEYKNIPEKIVNEENNIHKYFNNLSSKTVACLKVAAHSDQKARIFEKSISKYISGINDSDMQNAVEEFIQDKNYNTAKSIIEFLATTNSGETSISQPGAFFKANTEDNTLTSFKPLSEKTFTCLKEVAYSNSEAKKFIKWAAQKYPILNSLNEDNMQNVLEEFIQQRHNKNTNAIISFLENSITAREENNFVNTSFLYSLFCKKRATKEENKDSINNYLKPFSAKTIDCLKDHGFCRVRKEIIAWAEKHALLNNAEEQDTEEQVIQTTKTL